MTDDDFAPLVTRGDAKIDYRRYARARERDNPNSRHLPSPWHSRFMILLPSLAHGPEQAAIYRQKSLNRSRASSV